MRSPAIPRYARGHRGMGATAVRRSSSGQAEAAKADLRTGLFQGFVNDLLRQDQGTALRQDRLRPQRPKSGRQLTGWKSRTAIRARGDRWGPEEGKRASRTIRAPARSG